MDADTDSDQTQRARRDIMNDCLVVMMSIRGTLCKLLAEGLVSADGNSAQRGDKHFELEVVRQ